MDELKRISLAIILLITANTILIIVFTDSKHKVVDKKLDKITEQLNKQHGKTRQQAEGACEVLD